MRLNRKTQPLVMRNFRVTPSDYQQQLEQQRRSDQQLDIALCILGAILLVMLFVVDG